MKRLSLPERLRSAWRRSTEPTGPLAAAGAGAVTAEVSGRSKRGRGMRKFRERNLTVIGIVTALVLIVAVVGALNFSRIPFLSGTRTYHAMFVDAGDLTTGDIVTVAGVRLGKVTGLSLDHAAVKVTFTLASGVHLGSTTSAAMKVLTPIGQEYVEVDPSGSGHLSGAIPESRTSVPETLISDLSTLSAETAKINISQLERSLDATSATLNGIPKATVASALGGLARFSSIIASRQQDLSTLVTSASKLSGVLADHSAELVDLVGQGDLVLKVLEARQADIRALLATTSTLGQELTALLNGNQSQLTSLVDNLDTVSATLAKDSGDLGSAVPLIEAFSRYSANLTGSGPFADFTLPTLLIPDNVIAQCSKLKLTDTLKGCRV